MQEAITVQGIWRQAQYICQIINSLSVCIWFFSIAKICAWSQLSVLSHTLTGHSTIISRFSANFVSQHESSRIHRSLKFKLKNKKDKNVVMITTFAHRRYELTTFGDPCLKYLPLECSRFLYARTCIKSTTFQQRFRSQPKLTLSAKKGPFLLRSKGLNFFGWERKLLYFLKESWF